LARQQSYDRISQERSRRPDWSRRLLRRRLDRGRLPQRCHRSATNAIAGIATTDRPGPDHPRGSSRRVWAPITYPTPLRACQGEHSSALAGQVPQYAANGVLGAARAAPRPRTLGCGRERESRPDCRTGDGAAATSAGLGPRGALGFTRLRGPVRWLRVAAGRVRAYAHHALRDRRGAAGGRPQQARRRTGWPAPTTRLRKRAGPVL